MSPGTNGIYCTTEMKKVIHGYIPTAICFVINLQKFCFVVAVFDNLYATNVSDFL